MFICTGIPDGEWASAGCQLTWERDDFHGKCPVCRGILKSVAVKTMAPIKTILREETVMTKPVIPNNVADAIESLRSIGSSNARLIELARTGGISPSSNVLKRYAAKDANFDTLLAALVNGYEREITAEQRAYDAIRSLFKTKRGEAYIDGSSQALSYLCGIKFTLDTLGVKITEVNV